MAGAQKKRAGFVSLLGQWFISLLVYLFTGGFRGIAEPVNLSIPINQ
jgi:hypothetical protein